MHKPTLEEIAKAKTSKGGFNKEDLERWGIPWPPKKGWLKKLVKGTRTSSLSVAKPHRKKRNHEHRPTQKRSVYKTEAWKRLRYEVLTEQKSTCQLCGATPLDGVRMNLDHIYPLNSHPHLALVKSNLRVLCSSCNWGKGGRNPDDYEGTADADNVTDEWAIPWDRFDKF